MSNWQRVDTIRAAKPEGKKTPKKSLLPQTTHFLESPSKQKELFVFILRC